MRNFLLSVVLALAGLLAPAAPLPAVDGQWRALGPEGARVTDLVFQPGNPQVMYAAVPGGVFKSVDGGASWAWMGVGLHARSNGGKLAIDPVQTSTIYVNQSALYRSRNGGLTWQSAGLNAEYGVAVHPKVSGTVFAASEQGLFRSLNGGASWTRLKRGLPERYRATLILFDPTSERRLYASIEDRDKFKGGLYRSLDGGVTWQPIHRGPLQNRQIHSLAVDPRFPQTLYAGTSTRVFKSTNSGLVWKPTGLAGFRPIGALKVHPSQSNVVYAGGAGVFRSQDGGATWARISRGLPDLSDLFSSVAALAFHPSSPETVYAAVSSVFEQTGLYKSTNGGSSWASSSRGLFGLFVQSIAVNPQDPATLWVIANTVLFKSTDRGQTWARIRPDPGAGGVRATRVAVDPVNPATVYVMLPGGDLRRTHDGGQTWEVAASPEVAPFSPPDFVIDPQTPSTIYAAELGIAKSTDGGTTWSELTGDPLSMVLQDLVISPTSPSTLYAAGGHGTDGELVLKSTDGGATWTRILQGLPPDPLVFDLEIDPLDPATVYAVLSNGVIYKTTDGGTHWEVLSDAFRDQFVVLHTAPSGRLYAGVAFDDTYELQEGTVTWEPLGQNPLSLFHATLVSGPSDPCRIYVGTVSWGLVAFTKAGC